MILSETKQQISNPEDVAKILQNILKAEHETDRKKEHVWIIGLNASNIIEYIELVYLGTLNNCPIHPREIYRLAIMKSVMYIIFIHNHPSGNLEPSTIDIKVSKNLKKAGEILGISILDSLIITEDKFLSFSDQGIL